MSPAILGVWAFVYQICFEFMVNGNGGDRVWSG